MVIMSEGLIASEIKMYLNGSRREGFSSFSHRVTSCTCLPCGSQSFDGYLFTITTLQP